MPRGTVLGWLSAVAAWLGGDDEGETIAEYGLILAGVAIVLMTAATVLVPWLAWW